MADIQDNTPALSRRALFGGAGKLAAVAALTALPAAVLAHPGAQWREAVARYERAKAAEDAYYAKFRGPADNAYMAGKRQQSSYELPGDDTCKPTVWGAHTLKHFAEPQYANADAAIVRFARAKIGEITAVEQHNGDLYRRLEVAKHEDAFDRLVDLTSDAVDAVIAFPAPDMAAVAYKLRLLVKAGSLDHDDGEDSLLAIAQDADRLSAH